MIPRLMVRVRVSGTQCVRVRVSDTQTNGKG